MTETGRCFLCPRNCGVNRKKGDPGYCRSDEGFRIASICIHKGEEPVISGNKGVCNIFFEHCNMQCVYCQNHQISNNHSEPIHNNWTLNEITDQIRSILDQGIRAVGFVSPSHFQPQVIKIIKALKSSGLNPVFVYNTNSYEKPEKLRELGDLIDVFLPDFKYMERELSSRLSSAHDYPEIALNAIKEMYHQQGSTLITDNNGYAISGLIVRHLVLPGFVVNSLKVLRTIAGEISPNIHLSLMSQYYPPKQFSGNGIPMRTLYEEEYQTVLDEAEKLGFHKGWFQELDSHMEYQPDFTQPHPFA